MEAAIYLTFQSGKTVKTLTFEDDAGAENNVVNLYPDIEYQTIEGFGGAVTEAACYAINKLPKEKQEEIFEAYFGRSGIGYRFIRTHLDSCDFSLGNYSAMNDANDTEMKSFSLGRDEKLIIPSIRQAIDICPEEIRVMLTPWSPPSFMKTNGQRNGGGSLKYEFYQMWAAYICRYIKEYNQRGISVSMLSVQNEPKAVQVWDSCVFTASEEREFLCRHLWPALQKNGLQGVQVLIWDHNKERMYERACEIIDEETDGMVSGVAFHWYSGDHFEAIRLVSEKFSDKKLVFSEGCVEFAHYADTPDLEKARRYAHDIIGNLNNGMNIFFDWNIALDERGGPNHAGNFCDAPVICYTGAGTYKKNLIFDYIGHFSKFIKPGAKRIAFTKFTDTLDITAAVNPCGEIVSIIVNRLPSPQKIVFRLGGRQAETEMGGDSIATICVAGQP